MIIIIDHYDSFTYNIFDLLRKKGYKTLVLHYNLINENIIKIIYYNPILICIGPGPGDFKKYIKTFNLIKYFYKNISLLGICLGHQIISKFFGLNIKKSTKIAHGFICKLILFKNNLFKKIPKIIKVVRYNSLTVLKKKKSKLKIISVEKDTNDIMILKHNNLNILTMQFHPESIFTIYGNKIINNFLNEIKRKKY
ncbi:aminodeoxychorismate/anthranilate synthase component II [Candidatus Vidania fulgoroideorum]